MRRSSVLRYSGISSIDPADTAAISAISAKVTYGIRSRQPIAWSGVLVIIIAQFRCRLLPRRQLTAGFLLYVGGGPVSSLDPFPS